MESPLNPVSDEEIARVYEERRLIGLRALARYLNDEMKEKGIQDGPNIVGDYRVLNMLITDIDSRDADYLYFSINNRKMFEEYEDFPIPEQFQYGPPYDEVFRIYASYLIRDGDNFMLPENWIPYVMMKHADKLSYLYLSLYKYDRNTLAKRLKGLLRGIPRDQAINKMIDLLQEKPRAPYVPFSEKELIKEKIVDNIISMIRNGLFDVIDTIYLILGIDDGGEIYTEDDPASLAFIFRGFRKLVS